METLLPLMVGTIFAVGLYFILHRHLFKVILGLILFGLATNLFLFIIGGLTRGGSAIIQKGQEVATEPYADPIPQALLLTAIVIGFGIQAFAIVLIRRVYMTFKSNNIDDLRKENEVH